MTPGAVVACCFATVGGSRRLGLALPQLRAIQNARLAAAEIFAVIDRVNNENRDRAFLTVCTTNISANTTKKWLDLLVKNQHSTNICFNLAVIFVI